MAAALAATSLSAAGQQLNTEVVIDREIEPEVREVARPAAFAPQLFSAPVAKLNLRAWEYDRPGQIRRQLTVLDPARYADTIAVSPYRGYASVGYLPAMNLGANAGYRFINRKDTRLGAWLNYSGQSYHVNPARFLDPTVSDKDKVSLSQHVFDLGADFSHNTEYGTLGIDAAFTYGTVSQPMYKSDFNQNVTGFELNAGWHSVSKKLPWHLAVGFSTFGFDKVTPGFEDYALVDERAPYKPDAVRDYNYTIKGGIEKPFGNHSAFGLDMDLQFQHLSQLNFLGMWDFFGGAEDVPVIYNMGDCNYNVLRFTPYYRYARAKFSARIGLDVAVCLGEYKKTRFNANALMAWTPSQQFAAWLRYEAPVRPTTLHELYNYSPYMSSMFAAGPTLVNGHGTIGVTIGPLKGFSLEIWGGCSDTDATPFMVSVDNRDLYMIASGHAFTYGARARYSYNSLFTVHASAEGSQNGDDNVNYLWLDHAKYDVKAGFEITPIEKLTVGLDWHFRSGRNAVYCFKADGVDLYGYDAELRSLGIVNDLGLHAAYRISDALTVSANLQNLMCRRWQLVQGVDSPRLNGLLGVSYKF